MTYNKLYQYIAMHSDLPVYKVFKECGLSSQTNYSMRYPGEKLPNGRNCGNVSLDVIDRLCAFLHCQPSDIMELGENK